MLTRDLYYRLKPFIPRRLRLGMRRWRAQRILRRCSGIWLVHEGSGRRPEGWPGWPDGGQFAFVLSHDVEGRVGLNRCRQLAELEMEHGFRSSFNFIPNGEYEVPTELLAWLSENGFEVGVHDWRHDGTLFRSPGGFKSQAGAINRWLAEWGAAGFRAGFMLHELDQLHALDIEYDSSTFDVDPFEPQADGVETVFPFWIPEPHPQADAHPPGTKEQEERGYMELPCTMVQDYNLFVVLKEATTRIWNQKVAWIARQGGMALLDTHPDYMAFGGSRPGPHEFPVEVYSGFLQRIRESYGSSLFHALPREVARYCRGFKPPHTRPPREVCMVVYNPYEHDNRVRRYAETLARRGDNVSVVSLAGSDQTVGAGELNGVRVDRVYRPNGEERGRLDYLLNYALFGWKTCLALRTRNFPNGCDLVHVHNMPEALVFAAAFLKWKGAKIILDIHDLMPELYQDRFLISEGHFFARLLRFVEAGACRFSHHVIVSNHLWKKTVAARSRSDGQLTALVNHVDLRVFHPRTRTRKDEKFIIVYPGSLNRHQGLDIAIEALGKVREAVPLAELHIYGGGPELVNLREQAVRLGLSDAVVFNQGVSHTGIGEVMVNADLGVVPKRADGFGNEAFSTKIMEFMSQGLPVVVSRTKIDDFYFNQDCVCFFEPGNAADLAKQIVMLAGDRARRESLARNAAQLVGEACWEAKQAIYLDLVDRLTRTRLPVCKAARGTTLRMADSLSEPLPAPSAVIDKG